MEVISVKGWPGLRHCTGVRDWTIHAMIRGLMMGHEDREHAPRKCLQDCRVAVIGKGRIGTQVTDLLVYLGCKVQVDNPSAADIVTIHADLNPWTSGMVDDQWISRMDHGVVIVNSARPQIVNERALRAALFPNGPITGYLSDFPLGWAHKRVWWSEHIAGWTTDLEKTEGYVVYQIERSLGSIQKRENMV